MNNYIRESKDRTKSERIIDRHVSLADIEPHTEKKLKIAETASTRSVTSVTEGLQILENRLKNPKLILKCLPILQKLITKSYTTLNPSTIFNYLSIIFSHNLEHALPIPGLEEIFKTLKDLDINFSEIEKEHIKDWEFISNTFNCMHTDDSILFHKLLKIVDAKADELTENNSFSTEYGRGLLSLKKYLNFPWSRSGLMNLVTKCYRKIRIFETSVSEGILQMLDSKNITAPTAPVLELLKAPHEVTDTRTEVYSLNSFDTWAQKQSGLGSKEKIT